MAASGPVVGSSWRPDKTAQRCAAASFSLKRVGFPIAEIESYGEAMAIADPARIIGHAVKGGARASIPLRLPPWRKRRRTLRDFRRESWNFRTPNSKAPSFRARP